LIPVSLPQKLSKEGKLHLGLPRMTNRVDVSLRHYQATLADEDETWFSIIQNDHGLKLK